MTTPKKQKKTEDKPARKPNKAPTPAVVVEDVEAKGAEEAHHHASAVGAGTAKGRAKDLAEWTHDKLAHRREEDQETLEQAARGDSPAAPKLH